MSRITNDVRMRFFDENPSSVVQPSLMVRAFVPQEGKGADDLALEELALVTFTSSDLKTWLGPFSLAKTASAWQKRGHNVYRMNGYIVTQSGFGAPNAVMQLEELAAFGVKRAIYLGYCGSLREEVRIGDILVPTEAVREEGTSYHYLPEDERALPDWALQEELFTRLQDTGLMVRKGIIWTTDAPYRETPTKVARYGHEGILGVEMEMAALFAMASVRNVSVGAILIVSDELSGGRWRSGFLSPELKRSRRKVIDGLRPRFGEWFRVESSV